MDLPDRIREPNRDRRLVLLGLVILLVLIGSGAGTLLLGSPFSPPTTNETTPTPTAPPPGATVTPTPGGGGPPTATDTPTPSTPGPTATPTTTPTTATPADTPESTPDSDDDDEPSNPPATPSPGLELGGDGHLLRTSNLVPGESGQGTLTLRNAENEDGELTITAVDVVDHENGINDPESDVDSSPGVGELSSHLEVRLAVRDQAGNEQYVLGTGSGYVALSDLTSRPPSAEHALASGEEATLVVDWRLPTSAGNEVQSDGVTVDLGLGLESSSN